MEKAVLKTLIYADIFDYPLKINEIHKWLIGKKVVLRQVEKAMKVKKEYYFLPGRDSLVSKRRVREKNSVRFFRKAQAIAKVLKLIPWVKLIGISGGLALNNAAKSDDIDFLIITAKNRLWISRLLALGILSLMKQRRKRQDNGHKIAGKICLNILLEEDRMEQKNKDIYVAHEVLQMRVLWQRDGIYSKYLEDNAWAFKLLPNWIGDRIMNKELRIKHNPLFLPLNSIFNIFETIARNFQLWYMESPKGMERIEDGALYFHPNDIREKVLTKYNQSLTSSASFWYKSFPESVLIKNSICQDKRIQV